ncbi:hypothetical protein BO99DRAFT_478057 [Aspergillus violaceofuscus CBS 115571]|uniref:Uncharacterized protein n=1 Tax=Aspergillus violaceofuscus (strain CBS 115571) TaxID=1450538 RepID=A0A2V5GXI0_ASPV1|nr:hypothetical protein BO99DRAFT_478057 [Aspergillus violaceofuscus CBS 115571]
MAALAVRAASDSCPANTQWYVCAKGGYSGCCSVDPCTSGVCADDSSGGGSSSSSSSRSEPATSKISSTSSKSTVVEVKTKTTSTSPSSRSTTSATTTTTTTVPTATRPTTTANTATTTSTPTLPATTHHKPNRINQALIAGVVGGILALLILAALVLYSIYRAKKRRRGQFRLLHWRHPGTLGSGSTAKVKRLIGGEESGTEMVETKGSLLFCPFFLEAEDLDGEKVANSGTDSHLHAPAQARPPDITITVPAPAPATLAPAPAPAPAPARPPAIPRPPASATLKTPPPNRTQTRTPTPPPQIKPYVTPPRQKAPDLASPSPSPSPQIQISPLNDRDRHLAMRSSNPESVSPLVSPETTPTKKPPPAPGRMRGHHVNGNFHVNVKPPVPMRGGREGGTLGGAVAPASAVAAAAGGGTATAGTRTLRTERRRAAATAAELSDTGFYRQRAELPARMERELINVPWRGRRWEEGGEEGDRDGARERRIITADGAVMVASIQTVGGDEVFD